MNSERLIDFQLLKRVFPGFRFCVIVSGFLFSFFGVFIVGFIRLFVPISHGFSLVFLFFCCSGLSRGLILWLVYGRGRDFFLCIKMFAPFWVLSLLIIYFSSCLSMMLFRGPVPIYVYKLGREMSYVVLLVLAALCVFFIYGQFGYVRKLVLERDSLDVRL